MPGSSLFDESGGSLLDESGGTLTSEDFVAGSAPMALDPYAPKRRRVARMIRRWKTGSVMLSRTTPGAPDPDEPSVLGIPTIDVYVLDARVDGVAENFDADVTVEGAAQVVIASPKARTVNGAEVDIVPDMTDVLTVDGARRVIVKIEAVPSAGLAARFHIFIGA